MKDNAEFNVRLNELIELGEKTTSDTDRETVAILKAVQWARLNNQIHTLAKIVWGTVMIILKPMTQTSRTNDIVKKANKNSSNPHLN